MMSWLYLTPWWDLHSQTCKINLATYCQLALLWCNAPYDHHSVAMPLQDTSIQDFLSTLCPSCSLYGQPAVSKITVPRAGK